MYFRITGYEPKNDISFILDCNGMFEKLWQFSAMLVAKGLKVLEVSKLENGTVSDAVHSETGSVLSCSFAVSMMTKGSYAEYTNNIINNSDQYAAKLTYKVESSTGENVEKISDGVYQIGDYYKITIDLSKTDLTDISDSDSDLSKVTIRIEMIKTPVVDLSTVSIVVTFNAEAVEL